MIGWADDGRTPRTLHWVARETGSVRYRGARGERLRFSARDDAGASLRPPIILTVLLDPIKLGRIHEGIRRAVALRLGRWEVIQVEAGEALMKAARTTLPALVILEEGALSGAAGSRDAELLVDDLRGSFPHVPLVIYLDPDRTSAGRILELGKRGVSCVIEFDRNDRPAAVADVVSRVCGLGGTSDLFGRLFEIVPPELHTLILRAYAEAGHPRGKGGRGLTVQRLTRLWRPGAHRTTLQAALRRASLPSPGRLARWIVALRAATMLHNPGATVGQVALSLGFDSDAALREFLRRLTGRPPSALDPYEILRLFEECCGRPPEGHGSARIREGAALWIRRTFSAHSLEEGGADAPGARNPCLTPMRAPAGPVSPGPILGSNRRKHHASETHHRLHRHVNVGRGAGRADRGGRPYGVL